MMTRSSNMQMSAAASTGNAGSEGTVAKSPVIGLPRPMEIGPRTPEELKAQSKTGKLDDLFRDLTMSKTAEQEAA